MKNKQNEKIECWVCIYNDFFCPHDAETIIDETQHGVKGIEVACCKRCAIAFPHDVRRVALMLKKFDKGKVGKKHGKILRKLCHKRQKA